MSKIERYRSIQTDDYDDITRDNENYPLLSNDLKYLQTVSAVSSRQRNLFKKYAIFIHVSVLLLIASYFIVKLIHRKQILGPKFTLLSSSFDTFDNIPNDYTCNINMAVFNFESGASMNSPEFEWIYPPSATVDYLFLMSTQVGSVTPNHPRPVYKYDWCMYNISKDITSIPEGITAGFEGIQFCGSDPGDPDHNYYYMGPCSTAGGTK